MAPHDRQRLPRLLSISPTLPPPCPPHPPPPPVRHSDLTSTNYVTLNDGSWGQCRAFSLSPTTPPPTPELLECRIPQYAIYHRGAVSAHSRAQYSNSNYKLERLCGAGLIQGQASSIDVQCGISSSIERYLAESDNENLHALIALSPRQQAPMGELQITLERLGLTDPLPSPVQETPMVIRAAQPETPCSPAVSTLYLERTVTDGPSQLAESIVQCPHHDSPTWWEFSTESDWDACSTPALVRDGSEDGTKAQVIEGLDLNVDEATLEELCQFIVTRLSLDDQKLYQSRPSNNRNGKDRQPDQCSSGIAVARLAQGPGLSKSRKRPLQTDEDNDGLSEGGEEEVNGGGKRLSTRQERGLYACPFYRGKPDDPKYLPGGTHERCRFEGIKTDKLKEHIRRKHTKPFQCKICGRRGDKGEIKGHTKNVTCQPRNFSDVDEETLKKDALLADRRLGWHQVFCILFPNHPPLPHASQWFIEAAVVYDQCFWQAFGAYLDRPGVIRGIMDGFQESPEFASVDKMQGLAGLDEKMVKIISSKCHALLSQAPVTQETISGSITSQPQSHAIHETDTPGSFMGCKALEVKCGGSGYGSIGCRAPELGYDRLLNHRTLEVTRAKKTTPPGSFTSDSWSPSTNVTTLGSSTSGIRSLAAHKTISEPFVFDVQSPATYATGPGSFTSDFQSPATYGNTPGSSTCDFQSPATYETPRESFTPDLQSPAIFETGCGFFTPSFQNPAIHETVSTSLPLNPKNIPSTLDRAPFFRAASDINSGTAENSISSQGPQHIYSNQANLTLCASHHQTRDDPLCTSPITVHGPLIPSSVPGFSPPVPAAYTKPSLNGQELLSPLPRDMPHMAFGQLQGYNMADDFNHVGGNTIDPRLLLSPSIAEIPWWPAPFKYPAPEPALH